MKKLLFLATTLAIAAYLNAQEVYTADFSNNRLSFENIQATDGNTYTTIQLEGTDGFTSEIGKPKLPTRTIRLIIPFGKTVSGVSLQVIDSREYELVYPVYPTDSVASLSSYFATPDPTTYGSNLPSPSNQLLECNQSFFDGNNNIVTLKVCPFQYYPMSGILRQNLSISITITYVDGSRGGIQSVCRLQHTQDLYDKLLYDLVDNTEKIIDYRTSPTIVTRLDSTTTGLPVYEHVTIAPQSYLDSLQDFVDWKRQKGCSAGVVTLEQILAKYPCGDTIGTYPINDTPGKIRQFLHDSYSKGTCYAFIVGVNESKEQIRFGFIQDTVPPESYWLTRPSTDWYFCDLTGDWNANNDTCYGEPTLDNVHQYADIFVGRLLCSSPTDFGNWFRKLIDYEKNPGNGDPSFLTNAIITATGNLPHEPSMGSLIIDAKTTLRFLPSEYNTTLLFDTLINNQVHPTGAEVIDSLNSRDYGIMIWHNHGGTNNNHSGITVSHMIDNNNTIYYKLVAEDIYDHPSCPETGNGLDNIIYRKTPFVICAQSCTVIPFEKNKLINGPRRNCGESFTVGNTGGIAFLGFCVDNGSGNNCSYFAEELNHSSCMVSDAHLGVINDRVRTINRAWRYNLNLLGDPECQIWTRVPDSLQVSIIASDMTTYVRGTVRVSVGGLNTGEKATVTLYSKDDVFQVKDFVFGHQNHVEFDSVFPVTTTPISVTVTSMNHLPYQVWLPVTNPCLTQITSDTVWMVDFLSSCDIQVNSNATLTIKCDVGFNTNCKLVVMPGGKLILDGGTLFCSVPGYQWQGVRVYGTGGSGFQGSIMGQCSQGQAELINNAQIKDARVALDMWDGIHLATTGGVANARDAFFNNNGIAFRALNFQNINPFSENTNSSFEYSARFFNCYFGIDNTYPTQGELFRHHVELEGVKGVHFKGCEFALLNCPQALYSTDNSAIYAYNAGCMVEDYCTSDITPCPNDYYLKSLFHGFNMGINTIRNIDANPLTVKNAVFYNNDLAIRTLGDVTPTILFSDFIVGGSENCGVGVYLDNTTSFCIEENTFSKAPNAPGDMDCFGIVAKNTRNGNTIYRNSFDGLTCGNYADGENWSGDIFENGLEYCCNDNTANQIDFYVNSNTFQGNLNGIQSFQGSRDVSSGNTLSQTGVQYQFYNKTNNKVTYYYYPNNSNETPQANYFYNTSFLPAINPNGCASHHSGGGDTPVMSPSDRLQKEAEYQTYHSNYLLTRNLYESCIDGGNTSSVVMDISTATQSDIMALRTELLSLSPYLSQRALRVTTERDDILSAQEMFEILASNPEELGRDNLLDFLVGKDHPLPSYMLDILREVANGNTYRSALESQLASYKHGYRRTASEIVRSIQNDTVLNMGDLIYWMGNLEDINADRQIIALYLESGNDSAAFALADMLPELYGLQDDALDEHEGFLLLTRLLYTLKSQQRSEFEMTGEERALVDSLYLSGTGLAQNMARGICEHVNRFSSTDCPSISTNDRGNEGLSQTHSFNPYSVGESWTFSVSLCPNPATTWVTVDYTLPNEGTTPLMTITNSLGVTVKTVELQGITGNKVLDLRDLPQGVYIYSVSQGVDKCMGKLIITK